MTKITDFIAKHKGLSILIGLTIILFVILLIIFISLFINNGGGSYGNRLDGIEEVKIEDSRLKELSDTLKEKEEVKNAKVRIQGKIVYVVFEVTSETSIDTAKSIADSTLESFDDDELAFYDFSYLIKWTKIVDEKEEISAIEGTKHHTKNTITWSKS